MYYILKQDIQRDKKSHLLFLSDTIPLYYLLPVQKGKMRKINIKNLRYINKIIKMGMKISQLKKKQQQQEKSIKTTFTFNLIYISIKTTI